MELQVTKLFVIFYYLVQLYNLATQGIQPISVIANMVSQTINCTQIYIWK